MSIRMLRCCPLSLSSAAGVFTSAAVSLVCGEGYVRQFTAGGLYHFFILYTLNVIGAISSSITVLLLPALQVRVLSFGVIFSGSSMVFSALRSLHVSVVTFAVFSPFMPLRLTLTDCAVLLVLTTLTITEPSPLSTDRPVPSVRLQACRSLSVSARWCPCCTSTSAEHNS